MSLRSRPITDRQKLLSLGPLESLKDMLTRANNAYGDSPAIVDKIGNTVVTHSMRELKEKVDALGTSLMSMGLQGERIAIIGENSFNWALSFLAITCGVGVAVPLDKELTDEGLCELMHKADVKAVFCSRTYCRAAELYMQSNSNAISITLDKPNMEKGFVHIDELLCIGAQLLQDGDDSFLLSEPHADMLCAILFTSGTTGANKGVMLTHGNFTANIDAVAREVPLEDSVLSVLPMNHIYELNCTFLSCLYLNVCIYINDSLRKISENFNRFSPKMAIVVPLFLEMFYKNIWQTAQKNNKAAKLKFGIRLSNFLMSFGIDLRHRLFAEVREAFGGELSLMIVGGAPVDAKYVKGLSDLGFDIYIGYGLTEASPIAALNQNGRKYPKSSGFPFEGNEYRIFNPDENGVGEIHLRGKNIFNGYYNDSEATAASFDGEWFKTGDYGKISKKSGLQIVGRKKNLIVLSNGKNVHPEEIEAVIKDELPYVAEAVVIEGRQTIRGECLSIIKALVNVEQDSHPELRVKEFEARLTEDIKKVNARLPGYKAVSKVQLILTPFETTSTKKVIRAKLVKLYSSE